MFGCVGNAAPKQWAKAEATQRQATRPNNMDQESLSMNQSCARLFSMSVAVSFFYVSSSQAQSLSNAQIRQIEEIAQNIARQHNANSQSLLNNMTASSRAVAVGRNVQFENVLRVRKGLPPSKISEFATEMYNDVVPKSCSVNANNPAFDRGLSYTFTYTNTYGERLAEFTVDKQTCAGRK